MRTWVPIALLAIATCILSFYVVRLHGEVKRVSRAVGIAEESSKRTAASGNDSALTQRVASLEKELEAANGRAALLHARQQLAPGAVANEDPAKTKDEVLSIVADEADRIFVEQLLWHRNNLLSARQPGFRAFAQVAQLTAPQSQAVWSQLEAEADEFVEILRTPELRSDPAALIKEIQAVLAATDDKVRASLTGNQIKLYEDARALERAALMPWLQPAQPAPQ